MISQGQRKSSCVSINDLDNYVVQLKELILDIFNTQNTIIEKEVSF